MPTLQTAATASSTKIYRLYHRFGHLLAKKLHSYFNKSRSKSLPGYYGRVQGYLKRTGFTDSCKSRQQYRWPWQTSTYPLSLWSLPKDRQTRSSCPVYYRLSSYNMEGETRWYKWLGQSGHRTLPLRDRNLLPRNSNLPLSAILCQSLLVP
jgi:hypothetical protein